MARLRHRRSKDRKDLSTGEYALEARRPPLAASGLAGSRGTQFAYVSLYCPRGSASLYPQ
jgi:hypothetical protein